MLNMSWPTSKDVEMLKHMSKNELTKLFFMHLKNVWRVDGLYFLGIEKKFGITTASEIDAECWEIMGRIEARELKETLGIKENNVAALVQTLRNSSWALYQTEKESEASAKKGFFRVKRCRIQETRIAKDLGEFPCKQVRLRYLKSFTEEFNPNVKLTCRTCPPDPHSEGLWCEWEFTL